MKWFKKKTKDSKCKWAECCDCNSPSADKEKLCEKCTFYWWIDSGYGYCRVFPQFIIVPWCRDTCSLFKEATNE